MTQNKGIADGTNEFEQYDTRRTRGIDRCAGMDERGTVRKLFILDLAPEEARTKRRMGYKGSLFAS